MHGFPTKVSGFGGHWSRVAAAGGLVAALGFLWLCTAADAAVDKEVQFVLNTFSFLIWGALVMWMCAGFTMLESGMVRTKNVSMICLKNIGLYSIAGLMYFFIGYNLMYVDVGSFIGTFTGLYGPTASEVALLAGQEEAREAVLKNNYATMSDWFFQMVFVATTASIVSGT
ncbi:MAG: ammonium transporter, partial [Deltaproteobacteria bacterium]|nr:ammonium transporter [Deltaproteobacteria bacterium]